MKGPATGAPPRQGPPDPRPERSLGQTRPRAVGGLRRPQGLDATLLVRAGVVILCLLLGAVAVAVVSRSDPSVPLVVPACGDVAGGARSPVAGLVAINGPSGAAGFTGVSVSVPWAALQPSAGGPIVHPNAIDAAIAQAQALPNKCAGVKVRVLAGVGSPYWAKQINGPPVEVALPFDGISGTIGRFWTPQFGTAYDQLQRKLAAAYDANPWVREVAVSRCMTFYAEPLIRDADVPQTVDALLAAGYSVAADQTCQAEELRSMGAWHQTSISLALNPYEGLNPDGSHTLDVNYSLDVAGQCRQLYASRCVLGNNSIHWPLGGGRPYARLYRGLGQLGGPLEFQLAAAQRVGDLAAALGWCADQGALSVEVPPELLAGPDSTTGGVGLAGAAVLANWARFAAQPH